MTGPYPKQCSQCLPVQSLLASGGCERLRCFSIGSCCKACNLQDLIIYSFSLPVMSPGFKAPYRLAGESISYLFFSLSLSFIFFSYLLSKTMGCLSGCPMSSASIQKLFCGIYSAFECSFNEFVGEKVVSVSYSSAPEF